jgi:two-component system response regulator PilR (NtrC family)
MSRPQPAQILVSDEEPALRALCRLTLLRQSYRVGEAQHLAQARQQPENHPFDAVITDMRLPDGLGLELLRRMVKTQRAERCGVMTAYGSAENAVAALKVETFDCRAEPVDLKQFCSGVASAIKRSKNVAPSASLQESANSAQDRAARGPISKPKPKPEAGPSALENLVGRSAGMQVVESRIVKAAGSMAAGLIQGESGTGTEVVARAVNESSHRCGRPFVAVNCGAIAESLLEAEFFGVREGAHTGSTQDRVGYFQAAQGGTLFLDEIGDLPIVMQSKLLRAIQEKVIRPLGSSQADPVDVQIISASHKDFSEKVASKQFWQCLYHLLGVTVLVIPPLCERLTDLPELCEALQAGICRESGFCVLRLTESVLEQLSAQAFNGNVRELENILYRAVALGEGEGLLLDTLYAPKQQAPPTSPRTSGQAAPLASTSARHLSDKLQHHPDSLERFILCQALHETRNNRTAATGKLGMSLRQIRYRVARLNIALPGGESQNVGSDSNDAAAQA